MMSLFPLSLCNRFIVVKGKVIAIILSKLSESNFMNIILPALLKIKDQVKSESGLHAESKGKKIILIPKR